MPTAEQLARLLAINEAIASRALDGETQTMTNKEWLEHSRQWWIAEGYRRLRHLFRVQRVARGYRDELANARERIAALEGLLRRWVAAGNWYSCTGIPEKMFALLDDTLKALEATNDDATE